MLIQLENIYIEYTHIIHRVRKNGRYTCYNVVKKRWTCSSVALRALLMGRRTLAVAGPTTAQHGASLVSFTAPLCPWSMRVQSHFSSFLCVCFFFFFVDYFNRKCNSEWGMPLFTKDSAVMWKSLSFRAQRIKEWLWSLKHPFSTIIRAHVTIIREIAQFDIKC